LDWTYSISLEYGRYYKRKGPFLSDSFNEFFTKMNRELCPQIKKVSLGISEQGIPLHFVVSHGPRFAAKEAAYKAFQPARKVQWKDLEVWKHQSGRILRKIF
jgi:phosphopantetheinyl transferase (holo-ACP synthase)